LIQPPAGRSSRRFFVPCVGGPCHGLAEGKALATLGKIIVERSQKRAHDYANSSRVSVSVSPGLAIFFEHFFYDLSKFGKRFRRSADHRQNAQNIFTFSMGHVNSTTCLNGKLEMSA
jgi:hypothetical protein